MRWNVLTYKFLLFAAMLLEMCGCSPDTTVTLLGTGRLLPSVSVDASVYDSGGEPLGRHISNVPDASEFSLLITDASGRYRNVWTPWSEYDSGQGLDVGGYVVTAFYGDSLAEGFDKPYYACTKKVVVSQGVTTEVAMPCTLANTVFTVGYGDAVGSIFSDVKSIFHSAGGLYVDYPQGESRSLYVRPGRIGFLLDVTLTDGRNVRFVASIIESALPGRVYEAEVDAIVGADGVPTISVSFGDGLQAHDAEIELTEEFINSPVPVLDAEGFSSGMPVAVREGTTPAEMVAVSSTETGLVRLLLDVSATADGLEGLEREIDLMTLTPAQEAALSEAGIKKLISGDKMIVDFTEMIGKLRIVPGGNSARLSLIAVNRDGKVSEPVVLNVDLQSVDMTIKSVEPSIVGDSYGSLIVSAISPADNNVAVELLGDNGEWHTARVTGIEPLGGSYYKLTFEVPSGQLNVPGRLIYCDHTVGTFTVEKISPEFSITADVYAVKAFVTVHTKDADQLKAIVERIQIYANGRQMTVVERDESDGTVEVAGLSEDTRYDLQGTVFESPRGEADFCPVINVRTEKCLQLGNSSFEEVKKTIEYKNLASGGRYSQSIVPIFNQQNRANYEYSTPKSWANTNSKTICGASTNQNTWYMQPSVYCVGDSYSGGYAVKLQSAAWDPSGESIADYLQESQPYVYYSRNIPTIKYRAAGKLFLGSYGYDPATNQEVYDNIVEFGSRPSAVNGFYKYLPGKAEPSDRGLVTVELWGMVGGSPAVIASGRGYLTTAPSYTAFSVPLTYYYRNVSATYISLMFASTEQVGTIAYETANILTYNDPVTATSLGSELWIDEISLSY